MDDDHEFALEMSVRNIEDTNESDEDLDELSVVSADLSERLNEEGETRSNGGGKYVPLGHSRAQQPPTAHPVSLKSILDDERSFMLFRRFVKDGCISRNLQFWLACEHFRSQLFDRSKLIELATAIYKKFLGSSAPLHVSVLDGTKKKIQLTLQLKTELDSSLFLQAQNEVYHQMECNELRQFLLSDSFSDCALFNPEVGSECSDYLNGAGTFQPAAYRGGSLHSGSDDSTSVTSFNSDMSGTVLCAPRPTRPHLLQSPRNAHSDTEHYGSSSVHTKHSRMAAASSGLGQMTFFSRGKPLSSRDFYEVLYERLAAVEKDRASLQRRARNIAREGGKTYEEIMSLDWFDAPEAIKYVQFEGNTTNGVGGLKPGDVQESPGMQLNQFQDGRGGSHISSMAAKEIQEALKDMEITRQVRQKRTASAISTSSASSYISDSGLGESYLPSSSGGGGCGGPPQPRVHQYLQNQHRVTSQLSDREQKAHLAATMLINNSTYQDDLNPNGRRGHYGNYHGAYSSDDSSSCFTTTSQSSNSEFFIPRRPNNSGIYTESDDSRQLPRYPPGMRRSGHHKRSHASQQQTQRYYPPHQQPHPQQQSTNPQLVPPTNSTTVIATGGQSYSQEVSLAVHSTPSTTQPATVPSKPSGSILVAYTMEGFPNTMGKRLSSAQLNTLGDFKEKVFQRKGLFRFFFKTFCEDLNQELMEELSEDCSPLPRFEGKIIGHVEKVEANS